MPIGEKLSDNRHEEGRHKTNGKVNDQTTKFELEDPKYSLNDVIASSATKFNINHIISLKRNFDVVFGEMGFSKTHRHSKRFIVNFYGPPGTGKTITAHAIAKEFRKQILHVDYSQIESKYVGDTPKNLRALFNFAKETDCLLFFDEADAILSRRVTNMTSANDTSVNQTRSVLLNILNDFDGDIIFATNFISNYDPAFMRRIALHVFFELPDATARIDLFKKYIPGDFHASFDFDELAELSDGLSAADIEKVALMAAFFAASENRLTVEMEDIKRQILCVAKEKKNNASIHDDLTTRIVSKDYVESKIGGHAG